MIKNHAAVSVKRVRTSRFSLRSLFIFVTINCASAPYAAERKALTSICMGMSIMCCHACWCGISRWLLLRAQSATIHCARWYWKAVRGSVMEIYSPLGEYGRRIFSPCLAPSLSLHLLCSISLSLCVSVLLFVTLFLSGNCVFLIFKLRARTTADCTDKALLSV